MSGFIDRFSDYFCFYVTGLALGLAVVSSAVPEVTPAAIAFTSIASISFLAQAAIRFNRYSLQSIACAAFSIASLGFLVSGSLYDNNMDRIMGVAFSGVAFVVNVVMMKCRERSSEFIEQIV